jgi:hypothetical protein
MAGLLSGLFGDDGPQVAGGLLGDLSPSDIGMYMAAAKLLQSSGPSPRPIGTGEAIGSALSAGLGAYGQAREENDQHAMRQAQLEAHQLKSLEDWKKRWALQDRQQFIDDRLNAPKGGMSRADSMAASQALGQGAAAGSVGPTKDNMSRLDAIRPPSVRGPDSQFPFTLRDVTYLKSQGLDLSDLYKLATEPVKLEGGNTYIDRATGKERFLPKVGEGMQLGADGVSVAPGYLDSTSSIEAAKSRAIEGAKSEFILLPLGYVGQDGRPLGGTVNDYVKSLQQPSGQFPVPASTPPQGMPRQGGQRSSASAISPPDFPRVDPAMQRSRDSDAYKLISAELQNTTNPQDRAALTRELQRLQGAAGAPSASGVAGPVGMPNLMQPGRPLLQSEAEKTSQLGAITGRQGTQNDLNKNWLTLSFNPVVEAGRNATAMTASLDALSNIDMRGGWGAEAQAHASSVLAGLGVAPRNVKLFAATAEKFQSVAMQQLLTTLAAQKGPQTEGDAQRAQQTFVQIKNTPEANRFIADFARAKTNYDARRAQFYQEALPLAQQTGDLNEIDRRWQKIQGSIWSDPVLQRYVRRK